MGKQAVLHGQIIDFGKAVEATEMVDLVLTLNCCPIFVEGSNGAREIEEA